MGGRDYVSIGEEDYVCVMTRGHKDDTIVQEQILRTPAAYIGVIGSRRKKASVFRVLKEDGFTDRDLERITTPIGLEIGAETPAEIAISRKQGKRRYYCADRQYHMKIPER